MWQIPLGSHFLASALLYAVVLTVVQGDNAGNIEGSGRRTVGANRETAYSLFSCYNAEFNPHPLSFEDYLNGNVRKSFRLHRIWWSRNKHDKSPLGLFTLLSVSRVQMLEAQCRSYPGGLVAAAVWVPLVVTAEEKAAASIRQGHGFRLRLGVENQEILRNAISVIGALFHRMESQEVVHQTGDTSISVSNNGSATATNITSDQRTCALRILLLYELVADEQMTVIMPLNHLRNTALLVLDTPLAAMADVDLSVSWSLAGLVMTQRASEMVSRAQKDRVGWIMPTWDIDKRIKFEARWAVADAMLAVSPAAKSTVLRDMWYTRQEIHPFAWDRYKLGHNATQNERWLTATAEYPVTFEEGYEPWFFAYRKYLPQYDSRFRGHYYDKITNVRNVFRNGVLSLVVAPDVWMVHRPHVVAAQNNLYAQLTGKSSPLDQLVVVNGTSVNPREAYQAASQGFYKVVKAQMNDGTFKPLVLPAVTRCRGVLPWWRDGGGDEEGSERQGTAAVAGGRRHRR